MSIYTEGIRIVGKHSYQDYGLIIKERNIGLPGRAINTVAVPYMDGYYDFSALGARPAYTSRALSYSFDLIADTMQELDGEKNKIAAWLLSAHETEIYDDADPDYHFIGTCTDVSWTESDCSGVLTASFTAQPLRIHNATGEEAV